MNPVRFGFLAIIFMISLLVGMALSACADQQSVATGSPTYRLTGHSTNASVRH